MTMKKNRRESLSVIQENIIQKINIENVQFNKIKINKIQCIKSSYRSLLQSMSREKLTFYNIFFKKTLVSETKL